MIVLKFRTGDRVVHRSQRLDTLNTIEWVVYNVQVVEHHGREEEWCACRAIVVEVSPMGAVGQRVLDANFYASELKMAEEAKV